MNQQQIQTPLLQKSQRLTNQVESKYAQIDREYVVKYLEGLVNKVYKLLPLKEEGNGYLDKYHESLMLELSGFAGLFKDFVHNADFVSLLSSLESLKLIEEAPVYKRKVFECINLVKRMK